jgi:hypothetical protein
MVPSDATATRRGLDASAVNEWSVVIPFCAEAGGAQPVTVNTAATLKIVRHRERAALRDMGDLLEEGGNC